jgi:hypothetical protein
VPDELIAAYAWNPAYFDRCNPTTTAHAAAAVHLPAFAATRALVPRSLLNCRDCARKACARGMTLARAPRLFPGAPPPAP